MGLRQSEGSPVDCDPPQPDMISPKNLSRIAWIMDELCKEKSKPTLDVGQYIQRVCLLLTSAMNQCVPG